MKNNLDFYQHHVNSHNHWKFKHLRREYARAFKELSDPEGWAGEGKFWALNNMIAESEDCKLNTQEKGVMETISADLSMSLEQLETYLDILINKCKLVKNIDGFLTSKRTSLVYNGLQESRQADRNRKQVFRDKMQQGSKNSDRKTELSDRKTELSDRKTELSTPENSHSIVYNSIDSNTNVLHSSEDELKDKNKGVVGVKKRDPVIAAKKKKVAPKKKGKNPDSEPYWKEIRFKWVWFNKTHLKFDPQPIPSRDYSHMHRIIEKLRERAIAQAVEWSEKNALERWEKFLTIAYTKDKWIHDNFLLSHLESKMQKIFNLIDNPHGQKSTTSNVGRSIEFDKP